MLSKEHLSFYHVICLWWLTSSQPIFFMCVDMLYNRVFFFGLFLSSYKETQLKTHSLAWLPSDLINLLIERLLINHKYFADTTESRQLQQLLRWIRRAYFLIQLIKCPGYQISIAFPCKPLPLHTALAPLFIRRRIRAILCRHWPPRVDFPPWLCYSFTGGATPLFILRTPSTSVARTQWLQPQHKAWLGFFVFLWLCSACDTLRSRVY